MKFFCQGWGIKIHTVDQESNTGILKYVAKNNNIVTLLHNAPKNTPIVFTRRVIMSCRQEFYKGIIEHKQVSFNQRDIIVSDKPRCITNCTIMMWDMHNFSLLLGLCCKGTNSTFLVIFIKWTCQFIQNLPQVLFIVLNKIAFSVTVFTLQPLRESSPSIKYVKYALMVYSTVQGCEFGL